MGARTATDDEVERWRDHGWVLIEGLVGTDEIDAALEDLHQIFPTAEQYHADPEGETVRRLGVPPAHEGSSSGPTRDPASETNNIAGSSFFPFPGTGALNRLVVHPGIVDFAERALATTDLRVYQTGVSAKYTGITNYEQPMHTDRNHSWLPAVSEAPWWHIEGFLYLSDVSATANPTHLVSVRDSVGRPTTVPLDHARWRPGDLRAREGGRRCPRLVPGLPPRRLSPGRPACPSRAGSRFLLNVSYRIAGQDWIGYHTMQSKSPPHRLDPLRREFDSPPVGPLRIPAAGPSDLDAALIDATQRFYPKLDLDPWRRPRR
jgi:hypothetical protein